jgi:hypothetical protein
VPGRRRAGAAGSRLAPRFENVKGVAATRIEDFDDGDRIRDVFLRVEGRKECFDFLRDEFHF